MGYKPQVANYQLEFTEFPGLLVVAKGATIGELMSISDMKADMNEADKAKRMALFIAFAGKLSTWNIEHPAVDGDGPCDSCGLREDDPVPTTADAMLCLPLTLVMRIIMGWTMHMMRTSVPKEMSTFAGGGSSPEELTSQLAALQSPMA